jgi:hypothetical protein
VLKLDILQRPERQAEELEMEKAQKQESQMMDPF